MCTICLEWEKQRMTSLEAFRAIGEIVGHAKTQEENDHLLDLAGRIMEKEIPFIERNNDVEKLAIDLVEDEKKDKYGSS